MRAEAAEIARRTAGLRRLALAGSGRSLEVVRLPGQMDGGDDVPGAERQAELAAFCVVANIAEQTAHGEGGLELRRGVKHFPPGAKVWVLPPQWGDGADQLIIAGHHRGTHGRGFARMVHHGHGSAACRNHLAGPAVLPGALQRASVIYSRRLPPAEPSDSG